MGIPSDQRDLGLALRQAGIEFDGLLELLAVDRAGALEQVHGFIIIVRFEGRAGGPAYIVDTGGGPAQGVNLCQKAAAVGVLLGEKGNQGGFLGQCRFIKDVCKGLKLIKGETLVL